MTIYDWIKQEETRFETDKIQVGSNWTWNLREHVQLIFHLKNGVFYTGENNWMRAFKNIMEPMLQLAYWTEDIEVKDVLFYTESQNGRALSFLLKKYHDEVYVKEHDLDTLFDEVTESDVDYGGALVQDTGDVPEVIYLNSLAFCDQTEMLGAPMAFKHHFSPDKLREMSKRGWGKTENGATISLEDLCRLATTEKKSEGTLEHNKNVIPGKTIEVYIVKGSLPSSYLGDSEDEDYYCNQVHIIGFYTDKDGKKNGVTLYRKKDEEQTLFFHTSQKVYGRALGRGTGETLLNPQIWTNFLTIHKTAMLASGAKTPLVTDDPSWTQKNKIQDMENLEVTTIEEGKTVQLVPTINPNNIGLYQNAINEWYEHAQLAGSAFDPLMGKEESAGSTFRGQERLVAQGRGSHDRKRGKRAKFFELLYREIIIPKIKKEITKGKKFLATLSSEEIQWISEQLATNYANKKIVEAMLKPNAKPVSKEEQALLKQTFKESFLKTGNKKLIEIIKEDFEDVEIKMGINIAGKQKNLAMLSDKLLSVFQFVFGNPQGFMQAMQIPALSKSFADILEFSGLQQADFMSLMSAPPALTALQPQVQPTTPMTLNPQEA